MPNSALADSFINCHLSFHSLLQTETRNKNMRRTIHIAYNHYSCSCAAGGGENLKTIRRDQLGAKGEGGRGEGGGGGRVKDFAINANRGCQISQGKYLEVMRIRKVFLGQINKIYENSGRVNDTGIRWYFKWLKTATHQRCVTMLASLCQSISVSWVTNYYLSNVIYHGQWWYDNGGQCIMLFHARLTHPGVDIPLKPV